MSDFDKEAEREKLREKYEQEQAGREATEKMSELLLQGATMTNAHCSDCGDPIFRYDGQEFCATCEKAVDRGGEEAKVAEEADDAGEDAENIEVTSPDDGARVSFGGESADSEATGNQSPTPTDRTRDTRPAAEPSAEPTQQPRTEPEQPSANQHPPEGQQPPAGQSSQPRQGAPAREVPSVDPGAGADVTSARDSLVGTLTRFSQQAEATEDPQRAQEYLAAAREAAEALAQLRR